MTKVNEIPIRVGSGSRLDGNRAIAAAVLRAIADALGRFIDAGETGVIDLRALPRMNPATYQYLQETLAAGEVTAVIDAQVKVEVRETGYPGVWWLTHRNEQDAIVTEFIEITAIPEILKPHAAEISAGLQRLTRTLADPPPPAEPSIAGHLD